jgi:hypothetical protein
VTVEVIVSPRDIVVETGPRHEQATARRMPIAASENYILTYRIIKYFWIKLLSQAKNGFNRPAETELFSS